MRTISATGNQSAWMLKLGKRKKTRIIAVILLLCNLLVYSPAAYAAEPTVSVDEAAYVNLDYYGQVLDVNIVKGCSLNGITEFSDYGDYESVNNMSGYDRPIIQSDGVRWNLKNNVDNKRFYYSCKLKNDALELPWNIDVSYKLNGMPCKAETLAGASGVVEVNVKVKPNPQAKEYFKNNMILQMATYINMEDTYSLDAPGSQMQSVGTYKAVVFAALPGEEDTFTMRIGTKSFETEGIVMMMIPGTLKQLEDIKEIREAKDTLYDSYSAIYTSMNDILNTMESMKEGLSELQGGTAGMENARSSFSSGKDKMNEYADTALSDLSAANRQLKDIIPYFKTGQYMIKDIRKDINEINDSLNDLEAPLDETKKSISNMSESLKDLEAPLDRTRDSISDMRENLDKLDEMLGQLNSQIETALTNLGTVAGAGLATPYEATELQGGAGIASVLGAYSGNISSLIWDMQRMGITTQEIINITENLIDETNNLNDAATQFINITEDLIDKTNNLNGTLNSYSSDMTDLLGECRDLTNLLNISIDSTITFLSYTKSLLKTSGDLFDKASETSLKGMSDLLGQSIAGLGSIPTMRNANNTIKKTIDKEFDKYEDENKFLDLDAKAGLISFTSLKNPTPSSIQIILRTEEISLDDKSDNSDLEAKKADIGVMGRIKVLFAEIWGMFRHIL